MDINVDMAAYYSDVLRLNKDIQFRHAYDKQLNDDLIEFTIAFGK